jgi:predicted nucleic acid-binding protein
VSLVVDHSVSALWLLPQSRPAGIAYAESVLDELGLVSAWVPASWTLDTANLVARAESDGVVSAARARAFVELLGRLDLHIDEATAMHGLGRTLELARRFGISAHDAAYLELAMREQFALATLSGALVEAARAAGVRLFERGPD